MINYVVITPVRNEGKYIGLTINSMIHQTILPREWVIVDDGSTDATPNIIDQAANQYSWIKAVHRPDRGFRKSGEGVIEAFNDGYKSLTFLDWEYIVKLDGDLSFTHNYFEKCFNQFLNNAKLGIGGGTVIIKRGKGFVIDSKGDPPFHVRGATKIYRRSCWNAIGGLEPISGWDTLDEIKANMLGWQTFTFPQIYLVQHRPTGGIDGPWKTWIKNGKANYMVGYHPLFMAGKIIRRLTERPFLIPSLGLLVGYLDCYLTRKKRLTEKNLINYLRKQQLRKLFYLSSIYKNKLE